MNVVNPPVEAPLMGSLGKQNALLTNFLLVCRFLLPQDSNPQLVHLTTPHFKTNTPRHVHLGTTTLVIYITWVLGLKMTTTVVSNL